MKKITRLGWIIFCSTLLMGSAIWLVVGLLASWIALYNYCYFWFNNYILFGVLVLGGWVLRYSIKIKAFE